MKKPIKENFAVAKTDHMTPALIFFGLGIPMLLFVGMTRVQNLEQTFVYKEEARIVQSKEDLYQKGCAKLRQNHLALISSLEDTTGSSGGRIKEVYQSNLAAHDLYKSGEKIAIADKLAEAGCQRTLQEAAKIKRGSSTGFILSNFFGMK